MRYSILNPTGNITALVEEDLPLEEQPQVAELIMERHPNVEQVGFVCFTPADDVQVHLRMAGGEFCGNATMCAAALFVDATATNTTKVRLDVSGAKDPVDVGICPISANKYGTSIAMPSPVDICTANVELNNAEVALPVVHMEGISHAIVEDTSPAFCLKQQQTMAEIAVSQLCTTLNADGLGLMFLNAKGPAYELTPLVYVPGSNTVFWENSCASGSAAVGAYLSYCKHSPMNVTLSEPGGELRVESDWSARRITLHGSVILP